MKDYSDFIDSQFNELNKIILEGKSNYIRKCQIFAKKIYQCLSKDHKLIWCGNGGSATDCMHLSGEFVGRYKFDRQSLASICLSSDISVLTCVANDYSYEDVFARQISALGKEGDLLICLSTSGNSLNIIKAINEAEKKGIEVISFLGKEGGRASKLVKEKIIVDSNTTARIQEIHLMMGHIIVELVENMFGYGGK